jgi:hypothetical protein
VVVSVDYLSDVSLQDPISQKPVLLEVLHTSLLKRSTVGIIHCMNKKTRRWFLDHVSALKVVDCSREPSKLGCP